MYLWILNDRNNVKTIFFYYFIFFYSNYKVQSKSFTAISPDEFLYFLLIRLSCVKESLFDSKMLFKTHFLQVI